MVTTVLKIGGMSCTACSTSLEKALSRAKGVSLAEVSFALESAKITFDENVTNLADLERVIKKTGFKVVLLEENEKRAPLVLALCFSALLLYVAMAPMSGFIPYPAFFDSNPVAFSSIQLALAAVVMVVGRRFYVVGYRNLFTGKPNMDSLVAVGTTAAALYSLYGFFMIISGEVHFVHKLYFESAAIIISLVMFGKHLEKNAKRRTSNEISALISLSPKTATVLLPDGTERVTATNEVSLGDIIVVKEGESVPLDCEILSGFASFDEAMLTGESLPKDKGVSEKIFAGTVLLSGSVTASVQSLSSETVLAKIISTVEEASSSKAPITSLADKISSVFVPTVLSVALLSFIVWFIIKRDFNFALSIFVSALVIACPCALGLATPTAVVVGMGLAAKRHILFKNATALQLLGSTTVVVLDKTGTVTEGKPAVIKVLTAMDENEFLAILAGGEKLSSHPLARAVCRYAKERGISALAVENYRTLVGKGISFSVGSRNFTAGNNRLGQAETADNQDGSQISLFENDLCLGSVYLKDEIKETSPAAISRLKTLGIKTLMLTGDNERTAREVSDAVGVDDVRFELLPEQKSQIVSGLIARGEKVCFVGDGINDAPALAVATSGIAIGSGTDVAIESGEIVLTKSDLTDVCRAVEISRATMRTIKQNLFWAFIYNTVGIPIACGALYFANFLLNPMIAALCMCLSSVSVVTNSLRLNLKKIK